MDIINSDNYYNSIYQCIIINTNTDEDPDQQGRYQIYIPEVHYMYENIYTQYMNDPNKSTSQYASLFPWAIPLVDNLKEGDYAFGNYIQNKNNLFIILGKDLRTNIITNGQGGESYEISNSTIIDLAMPIIVENEIGLSRIYWPDNIPDQISGHESFGYTVANDNGAWSIGLIQWHGERAFELLYEIAKNDTNWLNKWSNQSLNIVTHLQKSLQQGSCINYASKWNITVFNIDILQGTKNMLTSDIGKQTQIDKAKNDTYKGLNILIEEPYKLSNPAIIIYLLDIMNQYGNYINSRTDTKGCLNKALQIQNNGKNIMDQFYEFREYWKTLTNNAYSNRRNNTATYIELLEQQGSLTNNSFVDLTELLGDKYVPEYGEYLWPLKNITYITAYWGDASIPWTYNFNYNSSDHVMGYGSMGTWHEGVDFGCPTGTEVLAAGNGTVSWVNGGGVERGLTGAGPGQGNCIAIRMDKNTQHNFVYMHLRDEPKFKVGDRVTIGQVIGYSGNTGNSTGPHLHLGLHIGENVWATSSTSTRIDPLPYLGRKAKG